MPRSTDGSFTIEDADIRWLNFTGKSRFDDKGDKTFNVFLQDDLANQMLQDGWNVQMTRPRKDASEEEIADHVSRPHVEVKVAFGSRPPRIVMIGDKSRKRTELGEDTCSLLDDIDIVTADVTIRPYEWDVNGKQGIKAYLKQLYVVIEESPLDLKWAADDGTDV